MIKLPAGFTKGTKLAAKDAYQSGETTDGIKFTTYDVVRPRRGQDIPARIAEITVYADGTLIIWEKADRTAQANISACNRLRDWIASLADYTDYTVSPLSSWQYLKI